MSMSDSGVTTTSGHILSSDGRLNNNPNDKSATEYLLEASKRGDLREVKRLVEECHVEPSTCHEQSPHRDSPLHLAAYYGRLRVVRYLQEKGNFDVECKNRFENTPLHRAARQGQLDVVRYLIEEGKSDPMCRTNWNQTALHIACKHGQLEVVKYLMENEGVDTSITGERYGCTALDLAARNGQLEVVQYMIEEKKSHEDQKESCNTYTPLHHAAFGGRLEIVEYLINRKVYDPMCKGRKKRTPLHSACNFGQLKIVKYYMDKLQVKIDSFCQDISGLNPLDVAALHGALHVVKYMVEEKHCAVKHDVASQYSAIHHAAYGGKLEVVQYFVEGGHCDAECPGLKGRTPLHSACRSGMVDVVDYLIGECKLNAMVQEEKYGSTPLHTAVKFGHRAVIERLIIKHGCDQYIIDHNNQTPSDYAKDAGKENIDEFLSHVEEIANAPETGTAATRELLQSLAPLPLTDLRRDLVKQLKPYTRKATPTGAVLGSGTYGSVIELTSAGETVAGKVFRMSSNVPLQAIANRVCGELIMMTQLHHPNIIQCKGVSFLVNQPLPVLLMEQLMSSLHAYLLHPDNSNLPVERKVSILHGTASGLDYLHSRTPAIIHRDLTAKNVLLDSGLRAKISDFGNSRTMDLDPDSSPETLTTSPGTLEYMPPEAQGGRVTYDPSLDVFSFGHLSLFTITQTPVRPLLFPNYHDSEGKLHARSEVKRRVQFVEAAEQLLSENQSLETLIKQCLHNNPVQRPRTGKLLTRLQEMMTPDSKPDMMSLISLSTRKGDLNIVEQSACNCREIGIILLKDKTGARVAAIAGVGGGPKEAIYTIYSHWVREDVDHSWRKLAQCLRRCSLNVLASDIEEHFGLSPPQQPQ